MVAFANPHFPEELTDLDLSGTTPTDAPAATNVVPMKTVVPVPAAPAVPASDLEAFYVSISKSDAEELRAVAARINERDRAMRAGIIDTGNDLIAIKDRMSGHFDRWLKLEFGMSKATAWNYISVAEKFGSAPKVVEVLPPATVYKLAAKATPADLRKAIVLEIESGAVPTKNGVEERIAEARYQVAEAKREKQKQDEAERQKQEDEKAWRDHAKDLADDGKTEAEIEMVKKKWDTAKEAKRRAKERAVEKREAEAQKWRDEHAADLEHRRLSGKRIADRLLAAVGRENFEAFRLELSKARAADVLTAIMNMDPASIDAASIVVSEEKAASEAAITEAANTSVEFGAF